MKIAEFPIWRDDGKPVVRLNKLQKKQIRAFNEKIRTGVYVLEDNPCLCGQPDDVVVAKKDRYGIPCENVLCRRCGLVRLKRRLDIRSNAEFYKNEYRDIYVGREVASVDFFISQKRRGRAFYSFLQKHIDLSSITTVFDLGCGAGGVLFPFHQNGKKVSGCDYGEKYLQFGVEQGLPLYAGELDPIKTPPCSQDLLILSHVMEHFSDPLRTVNDLLDVVTPGGFLLVQVPGVFWIPRAYFNPILYFQNAHVHNYYYYYLAGFFSFLGLEVVYGDERCTFLLKKPEGWEKKDLTDAVLWDEGMREWAGKVEHELKRSYWVHRFKLNWRYYPYLLKCCMVKPLEILGLKGTVKGALERIWERSAAR